VLVYICLVIATDGTLLWDRKPVYLRGGSSAIAFLQDVEFFLALSAMLLIAYGAALGASIGEAIASRVNEDPENAAGQLEYLIRWLLAPPLAGLLFLGAYRLVLALLIETRLLSKTDVLEAPIYVAMWSSCFLLALVAVMHSTKVHGLLVQFSWPRPRNWLAIRCIPPQP